MHDTQQLPSQPCVDGCLLTDERDANLTGKGRAPEQSNIGFRAQGLPDSCARRGSTNNSHSCRIGTDLKENVWELEQMRIAIRGTTRREQFLWHQELLKHKFTAAAHCRHTSIGLTHSYWLRIARYSNGPHFTRGERRQATGWDLRTKEWTNRIERRPGDGCA